ncbi:MFS family permease [Bacillus mesophilus]|uniref:MFS transporter n=1 Tax=Bacillus mesophilus TaxID=1808955 RepID=A0A6M0Q3D0_9BACI|nr:MFS transporter [Bacillus mesophilus]MBM7659825.1 MFS family permease [Bacillus mesophilus]NEY70684.1 MFS transporter [Bacillus mesophilus]
MLKLLKDLHPLIFTLLIGALFSRIANSMSLPFLAIYLSKRTDLSPLMIGIVIGAAPLASTVTGILGGYLSDKFGRKLVMLLSIYLWGGVFVGYAIAKDPVVFLLLSILNGICKAFFEPVSQALMGDLTDSEKRPKVFSLRYAVINMGVAIGPLLGVFIGLSSSGIGFIITGMFYLIYSLILHFQFNKYRVLLPVKKVETVHSIKQSFLLMKEDKVLMYFILGACITQIAFAQFAPLSHHMSTTFEKGVVYFGWMMTTNALVVVVAQIPLSSMFERFSTITGVYVGNALYGLGGLGFAFSDSLLEMILSMVIFTLGEVLCFPSGTILIDKLAPSHLRGSYYGAMNFTELGRFIGPTIGMFFYSTWGISWLFSFIFIILILSNLIYFLGNKIWRKPSRPVSIANKGISVS